MLLDTHALIWFLEDNVRLGESARSTIERATTVHASTASLWEMSIKSGLGQLKIPDDLLAIIDTSGLQTLPVAPHHALSVHKASRLPHRDPFDRLLVTQAIVEGLTFVTADRAILGAHIDGLVTVDARR